MADDEGDKPASGASQPGKKIGDFIKDVPWYYWLGGAIAGGAILLGAVNGQKPASNDTGIPQAYTTSPLDFASGTGIADGSGAYLGGGYGTTPPPTGTNPPPGSSPTPPMGNEYIVQLGDTLDSIAKRYNVPGGWKAIYNNNQATIIAQARANGRTSDFQNYIYQGEHLYLPTK